MAIYRRSVSDVAYLDHFCTCTFNSVNFGPPVLKNRTRLLTYTNLTFWYSFLRW